MKNTLLISMFFLCSFNWKNKTDEILRLTDVWNRNTSDYLATGYKRDYSDSNDTKAMIKRIVSLESLNMNGDTASLRYKFIATIQPIVKEQKPDSFYVVESFFNGQRTMTYNYLLLPNNKIYYFVFHYSWILTQHSMDYKYIDALFKSKSLFNDGHNQNYVMISLFKGESITCRYYLPGSINNVQYDLGN